MRVLFALLATMVACGPADPPATAQRILRFSGIPHQDLTQQAARFEPIAAYLRDALDVPVEYVPVSDYDAAVTMFRNGEVQLAWLGGLTGVQARQAVLGARAIAQGAEDAAHYSYFVAHRGAGLELGESFPVDALGMSFAFGSEHSTSGRLMPEFFIRESTGMRPDDFFSEVVFSGSDPKTLALVNQGRFQLGALDYRTYDDASADEKADVIVVWPTPRYADNNFSAHPQLETVFGAGFIAQLQEVVLAMPEALCTGSFGRSRMIEATDDDFESIAIVGRGLGLAR